MRFAPRWSVKALIGALIGMLLCGCSLTPQQRFNIDSRAWPIVKATVKVYSAQHPFTPAQAAIANRNFAQGDQNIADAAQWLKDNPALAGVPGDGPPSLNELYVAMNVLESLAPTEIVVKP